MPYLLITDLFTPTFNAVSMGGFCAGTCLAWTSPALPQILPEYPEYSNATALSSPGFIVTEQEAALLSSIVNIGAVIAAIPTGFLADKFGRKKVTLSLTLPFFISYILIIFARDALTIMIARFLGGIGSGAISVLAPMYIGEIGEAQLRGRFGSYFELFVCCGVAFTCIVGAVFNWSNLALTLAFACLIFGASFAFMPESPLYLVRREDIQGAKKVLHRLRGPKFDVTDELNAIQDEIEELNANKPSFKEIIQSKANIRAMISVVGVVSFLELCGINAIVFYAETIFKSNSMISPSATAIIMNLVPVIVTCFSSIVVEKAGRRVYLMLSSTGMGLGLIVLGVYFQMKNANQINNDLIPLASIIFYMMCFSIGYGPILWMLLSELFAPNIKGVATGVVIFLTWTLSFLVTYAFPLICTSYGENVAFYICAGCMAMATTFVYFVVPETRGKSLSEIQELLNK